MKYRMSNEYYVKSTSVLGYLVPIMSNGPVHAVMHCE